MVEFNPYQPTVFRPEESIVNHMRITPYKLSFAVITLAICLFFIGRIYVATNGDQPLGYQAFRGWAINTASIAMLVVGYMIAFVNFVWQRTRSRLQTAE